MENVSSTTSTKDEAKIAQAQGYWKANLKLISIVLAIWLAVSLLASVVFFPALSNVFLPGFQISLGFWFAHQGAMVIFVILIFAYAIRMDKIDKNFEVQE
ncbi:MAG: DUF4212 domain-containing protein [Anaerolineales bacterium]|nr:DUF4212 domain-containing protein [Anaerolineales bacterium]